MTRPDPPVPDEATLAFEALVLAKVTADVAGLIRDVLALILTTWEALARGGPIGAGAAKVFAAAVALRLRNLRWPGMDARLREAAREARAFGVDRAWRRTDDRDRRGSAPEPAGAVPAADAALRSRLREAARMASLLDLSKRGNVMAVVGRARSGLAVAQGQARWTAHEGINAGTAAVAKATGQNVIWVAERGACLDCLAHAGWVVAPGNPFPAVSFDPNANDVLAVRWPPLHPNCRCEIRPYDGPVGRPRRDVSRSDPAARLAAEARRTVVYQWTEHASNAAAKRAASALLSIGADLPRTVIDRARRALPHGGTRRPR